MSRFVDIEALESICKKIVSAPLDQPLAFGVWTDFTNLATPQAILDLIERKRSAEDAARFFYAKFIIGDVLLDEQCGELEKHEATIEHIGARCKGLPIEVVDDGEKGLETQIKPIPTAQRNIITNAGVALLQKMAPEGVKVISCMECNDLICGGTQVFHDRKCDGIPFR